MADETGVVSAFIRSKAFGGPFTGLVATRPSPASGLALFDDPPVPEGTPYPYATWQFYLAFDDPTLDGVCPGTQEWLLEGWTNERSYGPLVPIANAWDGLFRSRAPEAFSYGGGSYIVSARRRKPWRQAVDNAGVIYRRLGGFYRFEIDVP